MASPNQVVEMQVTTVLEGKDPVHTIFLRYDDGTVVYTGVDAGKPNWHTVPKPVFSGANCNVD